LLAV
jgi:hypothetical protein